MTRESLGLGGGLPSESPRPDRPDLPRVAGDAGDRGEAGSREKSRPYYRFFLKADRITLDLDLGALAENDDSAPDRRRRIREKKGAGARFVTARGGDAISSVTVWTGRGRSREERKLNLTEAQGAFLFHLPFPGAEALSVADIMKKAGLDDSGAPEIRDIVDRLEALGVIETCETMVRMRRVFGEIDTVGANESPARGVKARE